MKKITQAMRAAFSRRENMKRDNTEVIVRNGDVSVYLWNNKIAWTKGSQLWISSCGWKTNTTKERLNGLPGVNIYQKNFDWFLNGHEWDGEPVCVQTGERQAKEDDSKFLNIVAGIAMLGDIFTNNQKESNDWKARMLKAGLGNSGLIMPEDWDTLSEEEKERRLNGAIEVLK